MEEINKNVPSLKSVVYPPIPDQEIFLARENRNNLLLREQLRLQSQLFEAKNIRRRQELDRIREFKLPEKETSRGRFQRMQFDDYSLASIALKPQTLVPIRINLELDNLKLRDSFLWNLNDDVTTPEIFAKLTCDDFKISHQMIPDIAKSIRSQLQDYSLIAIPGLENNVLRGKILNSGDEEEIIEEHSISEMRIVIKLDISIQNQSIIDQFEWDISSEENVPEYFADVLVKELELLPEFKTAISHSIREQIQVAWKRILLDEIDAGRNVEHDYLLRQVTETARPENMWAKFEPKVSVTSLQDLKKRELVFDRASRANRRQAGNRNSQLHSLGVKISRTPLPKMDGPNSASTDDSNSPIEVIGRRTVRIKE